jgi:hypothetical protein
MKRLYNLCFLIVCILFFGCEKSIVPESNNSSGISLVGISDNAKQTALSIAEAQQQPTGTPICVKGFIVASTTKSMSNATYSSPFAGSTALVLASRQSNGTNNQFDNEELFPICLTDASKGIKEAYNLESNPQYYNQYVFISGTRDTYLTLSGLKKVKAIEVDPHHVVTQDEQPDAVKEGESIDDSEEEGSEEEDVTYGDEDEEEGEGTDEGTGNDDTVMTVAEAIAAPEQSNMTVKGYIVAAVKGKKENISFDYPGFNNYNTAIVLADKPYDSNKTAEVQFPTGYQELLIVYLSDSKPAKLKDELNLVSHPENQNKFIQVTGRKGFALGIKLLLDINDYEWATP